VDHRIKGIDGIRTIAVSLVIFTHYFAWMVPWGPGNFGGVGVSVFFVISGYLISGILLRERDGSGPVFRKFFDFYAKRVLRICPAMFVVITVALLLSAGGLEGHSPLWLYMFGTNVLIFKAGHWLEPMGHLWSVAVEEQFYLVWPAIILTIPKRFIPTVILAAIALTPVSTAMATVVNANETSLYVTPFQHCDALGLGALLAYLHFAHRQSLQRLTASTAQLSIVCFVAVGCFTTAWFLSPRSAVLNTMALEAANLLTALLIHNFWASKVTETTHGAQTALEWPPIRYLGRISYGIYLWHPLIESLFHRYFPGIDWVSTGLSSIIISVGVAALSYHGMERPILNHREAFGKKVGDVLTILASRSGVRADS
jgi:peptidoglycan/LPS O-acetylase OafA/YrhL